MLTGYEFLILRFGNLFQKEAIKITLVLEAEIFAFQSGKSIAYLLKENYVRILFFSNILSFPTSH